MRSADFIQETTTSIAGTAGNGAVTLTQVTGLPRFSMAFGTVATAVRYVIEDTVGLKFEQGIGSVASNVLTRTDPQVTWDGTTYTAKSSATPLAFGATPASGNIIIRMAATAESNAPVIDAQQGTVGTAAYRDYQVSGTINIANGGGSVVLAAGTQYYILHKQESAGLLSGMQLAIDAAVASSHLAVGLYDIGSNGLPNGLLVTFNVVDSSTTGTKTDTAVSTWTPAGGIWLTPGWYAIGILSDSAIGLHCQPGGGGFGFVRTPFGNLSNGYGYSTMMYVTQAYASGLQATFSGSATMGQNNGANQISFAHIGLKVAA